MKSIIFSILTFASAQLSAAGQDLQIWYIPFNVQTDKPMTRKLIIKGPNITLLIHSTYNLDPIKSMITPGQEPPNEHHIRLKMIIRKATYFFDAKGNGASSKGELVKIDKAKFEKCFSYSNISLDLGKEQE